jgi:OmpA-OmpF porin, OOP family
MKGIIFILINLAMIASFHAIAQSKPQDHKNTTGQEKTHSPAAPSGTGQSHHSAEQKHSDPATAPHSGNQQHPAGSHNTAPNSTSGQQKPGHVNEHHQNTQSKPASGSTGAQNPAGHNGNNHTGNSTTPNSGPHAARPDAAGGKPHNNHVPAQNNTHHKPDATGHTNTPAADHTTPGHPVHSSGTHAETPAPAKPVSIKAVKDGEKASAETHTVLHNGVVVKKNDVDDFAKYSNFDFIPGENVVFYDDFSSDSIGGFPRKWHTYGSGQIITAYKPNQRWFKLNPASAYIPEVANNLPDAYSLQFDIIINAPANVKNPKGTVTFSILSSEGGNGLEGNGNAGGTVAMHISKSGISTFNANTWNVFSKQDEISQQVQNDALNGKLGKPIQVSIMVFKQKFSMYLDDKKIFEIPKFVPPGILFDKFRIVLDDQESWEFLVSNFRFATNIPKVKNILQYDGKLVTRGLQFEYGAAGLKPISYGTIKEIAAVLKANPDWRVKIIGHTDDSGDDKINLQLSKNRAEMVKTYLVKYFQLNPMRFATEGMGETMPVSDNKTAEGRANNRRVEFVRF